MKQFHKTKVAIDKIRARLQSKYKNLISWLVFNQLKIAEPQDSSGLNIEAKIFFDKKNKSYFIQSTKYSEIYTASKSLEDLAKRFHDVVHYYFDVHRYSTQRAQFRMDMSEIEKLLRRQGFVHVTQKFSFA